MSDLKNLDSFNEEKSKSYSSLSVPRLNGIACPKCGSELYDSNPSFSLMTYPPKKAINCSKCEYTGYRVE